MSASSEEIAFATPDSAAARPEVALDGNVTSIDENEWVDLPIGCTHGMVNPGKIDLELIEVQVGSYAGEDDIVRIEDIDARA